ncbi:hypothetical protein [Bradyrhizobium sp. USDA 4509]
MQIHHIDDDNTNFAYENLAVLCLEHHNDTQVRGGFGRKLLAAEVIRYRDDWVGRVRDRRAQADKLVIERRALGALLNVDASSEWEPPAKELLSIRLNALPDVFKLAIAEGERLWLDDHEGTVPGMRLIVDVLSTSWVELSAWIDPYHFGGKSPLAFVNEYVAGRNVWNRMLVEPASYGHRARSGTFETLDRTLVDMQDVIERTAIALGVSYLQDFDAAAWRKRWNKPKFIG